MNGTTGTLDAEMAALRQEYDRLRQSMDLAQATSTVWELTREVGRFEERVEALRQGGYLFTRRLASDASDLRDRWRNVEIAFDRAMRDARYGVERGLDRVDMAMRAAERAPAEGLVQLARTEMQSLGRRLGEERRRLTRTFEDEERDIRAFDRHLDALEWSVQQIRAGSFQLDNGEAMILAAPAEWAEGGAEDDERDGVLYLTDRRLLLERKERTGAFLGIFGGRIEQALAWSLALGDVEDVRSEDRGILGTKQMLFLRARPGSGRADVSVEVKANADNQEWAGFIARAKSGGYEEERL
jgi:hypothetical protein